MQRSDSGTIHISAKHLALMDALLEEEGIAPEQETGISRSDRIGPLPLSFSQERLWFLDQLEPNSTLYNVPIVLRLTGPLEVDALRRALEELIHRHEVLRTRFPNVGGSPLQEIAETGELAFATFDLSGLTSTEQEAKAQLLTTQATRTPFDLSRGPLFRVTLLKLASEEHQLVIVLHHIVTDGWSRRVLYRELSALYADFSAGRPSSLPPLPIQYADYAAWQRGWLQGEELERQVGYWKQHLAEAPALLELPTDRPRPPMQTFRGERKHTEISSELTQKLKALGQQEGATLFMTLLAVFQTLLHRYSRQDQIVVGTPIANRGRPELEGLIGFFMNTLALCTDFAGDPSFRVLLRRVRGMALEAYDHQDLPFEKLVDELQPERNLSHAPIFQVMFTLQNTDGVALPMPGLKISSMGGEGISAKFDLMMGVAERGGTLRVTLEYSTDLFDADRIERLLGHFQTLLERIVASPDLALSHLPMLTEAERHQLLRERNDTQTEYPQLCLHELFEAQVARTPNAVAVEFENKILTYAELNARANQLAHLLRQKGAGPDVTVGLCVERSLEMAIGLLGILKAGAAYMPLDPNYPPARLEYILSNAQAPLLVCQQGISVDLSGYKGERVWLSPEGSEFADQPAHTPSSGVTPDHLLYVIYTSGSTGTPKGVAMPHEALVNLLHWQQENWSGEPAARTLQYTSPSFDVSCQEIFSTWRAGGTLVLVADAVRRDSEALLTVLESARIERLFLPFVALSDLAQTAVRLNRFPHSLREIVTAGEQLHITPDLVQFIIRLGGCTLSNQYGPTEAHVVTAYGLTGDPSQWPSLPSIGRPVANTQIHILNGYQEPAPVGVPGELMIGGVQVARGYLKRPELTAEKFVPDPFSAEPGARLYRTGDLARWNADGTIEFLGRVDHQVKIRGFRIELSEIESRLREHPSLQEVLVLAREDTPHNKRLVAYLMAKEEATPISELRLFLMQHLPEYMVPSAWVWLEAFPLSPNGKVDRAALPPPDRDNTAEVREFIAPRTPIEEAVAEIWAEVLGIETISVTDNFFDLGGHSLLATRVISRIYDRFGVDLFVRTLFQEPTVEGISIQILQSLMSNLETQ